MDACFDEMAPDLFEMEENYESAPILFDIDERIEETAPIHSDIIFKPLSYNICWVDVDYPYNQYSGYQNMLKKSFPYIPFRIMSDQTQASYELNTTMANTRFIVILSGRKKKNILKSIHDSLGVEQIFVLKQFCKLSNEVWQKISVVPDYESLKSMIGKFVKSSKYNPTKIFKSPKNELVDLGVVSDPMVMSEKCTKSVEYELGLKNERKRLKHKYGMASGILIDYFTTMLEGGELNIPLYNSLGSMINCSKEEAGKFLIILLKLSIEFDACNYILSPLSIDLVAKALKSKSEFNFQKFKSSAEKVFDSLPSKDGPYEILHEELIKYLSSMENKRKDHDWKELHLAQMMLNDIDLCLKLFLEYVFRQDREFRNCRESFSNASIASDARVTTVREIWKRAEFDGTGEFINTFTSTEKSVAPKQCAITQIILLGTSVEMINLGKKLKNLENFKEYSFIKDFEVEEELSKSLECKAAYFIIDYKLKKSQFSEIINICTKLLVIPIFVIYFPNGSKKKISKESFRNKDPLMIVYCQTLEQIKNYLRNKELDIFQQMESCYKYFGDFKKTLSAVRTRTGPKVLTPYTDHSEEKDGGWELLTEIDSSLFSQLVEEKAMNTKISGSLHYNVYNQYRDLKNPLVYWNNYAQLFGASERSLRVMERDFARRLLKSYTMQTDPGFYKLLNDAFRSGNPEKIGMYRVFYTSLLGMVRNGLLERYVGTVYRGTYFNPKLLESLKPGTRMYSTCFTSTSKSSRVAQEFARKTKRNVILEIELAIEEFGNVDIHNEKCSIYPEEFEVLLLPFGRFEIAGIFSDTITTIRLKQMKSEVSMMNFTAVDYYS